MSIYDDLPSDCEPLDVREQFARLVTARWCDVNITDLTDYRRRKMMDENQLRHDLANAFRSPPARHPDDKEPA